MNKKGQIGGLLGDLFLAAFIVFVFIFGLVISYTIWTEWNGHIQTMDFDQDVKDEINSWTNLFLFLDKIVMFMYLMLWGASIATSLLTNPDHPFFFVVSLILLLVLTFGSIVMVDFGTAFFDNESLVNYSSDLSNSYFFIHKLHYISFFVMLISLVFFYGKANYGIGQGVQR